MNGVSNCKKLVPYDSPKAVTGTKLSVQINEKSICCIILYALKNCCLLQIIDDIKSKLLHIVLIRIGTGVLIPFVSGETVGYAAAVLIVGIEVYQTGYAVVTYMAPCGKHKRIGCNLEVLDTSA